MICIEQSDFSSFSDSYPDCLCILRWICLYLCWQWKREKSFLVNILIEVSNQNISLPQNLISMVQKHKFQNEDEKKNEREPLLMFTLLNTRNSLPDSSWGGSWTDSIMTFWCWFEGSTSFVRWSIFITWIVWCQRLAWFLFNFVRIILDLYPVGRNKHR